MLLATVVKCLILKITLVIMEENYAIEILTEQKDLIEKDLANADGEERKELIKRYADICNALNELQ